MQISSTTVLPGPSISASTFLRPELPDRNARPELAAPLATVQPSLTTRPLPGAIDTQGTATLPSSASNSDGRSGDGLSANRDVDVAQKARVERENLRREQQQINQLAARDREVRAHEQAHAAAGGPYAGAPRYQFERGPDGVNYAIGGEVSIDVSPAATPIETIRKMQVVRRAALAPAEPSPQDRSVAVQAARIESQARSELVTEGGAARADNEKNAAEEPAQDSTQSSDKTSAAEDRASASVASSANSTENLQAQIVSGQSRLSNRILSQTGQLELQSGRVIDRVA